MHLRHLPPARPGHEPQHHRILALFSSTRGTDPLFAAVDGANCPTVATTRLTATETHNDILAGLAQISVPSLPVYQITGCKDPAGNPVPFTTTDPGAGLFSGLCADINRVKVPGLRGLAARAPYFHNGSAANLAQVVNFYNARFRLGLNPQQKTDLVNFLSAL